MTPLWALKREPMLMCLLCRDAITIQCAYKIDYMATALGLACGGGEGVSCVPNLVSLGVPGVTPSLEIVNPNRSGRFILPVENVC